MHRGVCASAGDECGGLRAAARGCVKRKSGGESQVTTADATAAAATSEAFFGFDVNYVALPGGRPLLPAQMHAPMRATPTPAPGLGVQFINITILNCASASVMPASIQKTKSAPKAVKASASKPPTKKNPSNEDKKKGQDSDFAELDSLFR